MTDRPIYLDYAATAPLDPAVVEALLRIAPEMRVLEGDAEAIRSAPRRQAALQPSPALTISGSVSSALSKLTWSDELLVRDFVLNRSTIDTMGVLNLAKAYSATEETLDPSTASPRALQMAEGLYDDADIVHPLKTHRTCAWKPRRFTPGRKGASSLYS